MALSETESWGRYLRHVPRQVLRPNNYAALLQAVAADAPLLAYGMGRSYGDVCLNESGTLVRMDLMNRILEFDSHEGVLRAEAGVSIGQLNDFTLKHGWFVPVTPGTKHVTLGGAIANDVHGKNHHNAGSFGCFVRAFEIIRSDGLSYTCSLTQNTELFAATIGGMGLTGLVTWVEIRLHPVVSRRIERVTHVTSSLEETIEVMDREGADWKYVVSWLDTSLRVGVRGLVHAARHVHVDDSSLLHNPARTQVAVPLEGPSWLMNSATIAAFNKLWYWKHVLSAKSDVVDLNPFFYPLDGVANWNRVYGERGFVQYQFVVPRPLALQAVDGVLQLLRSARVPTFLGVLKCMGPKQSEGVMSFPMEGVTLAIDIPFVGNRVLHALDECDRRVYEAGGRVYAAKDARISGTMFRNMYPAIERFNDSVDAAFSSSFWRRIQQS